MTSYILITQENTVTEINTMLDHAHVSVNWYGQRIVSIDGYESSVEINDLPLSI